MVKGSAAASFEGAAATGATEDRGKAAATGADEEEAVPQGAVTVTVVVSLEADPAAVTVTVTVAEGEQTEVDPDETWAVTVRVFVTVVVTGEELPELVALEGLVDEDAADEGPAEPPF